MSTTDTPDYLTSSEPPPRCGNWGRWAVLGAVAAGSALFVTFGPDERAVIARSGEWRAAARGHLPTAVVVFFVAEVVLIGLSVPVGVWLTVLAGFLFGTWVGTAVVSFASTAGAVLAFLAARYVFAAPLHRAARSRPRFGRWVAAIDRGFAARGAYYVLLLRLTPVFPFWALNLGLAMTPVRVRDYWWATQVGTLPGTLVVCHAGASLAEITSFRDILSADVLVALGLLPVVPLAVHVLVSRSGRGPRGVESGRQGR